MRVWMLLVLAFGAGVAQADAWDQLYGRWVGTGEVNGMASEVVLQFTAAAGGRGRQLRFENVMTGKDGAKVHFRADAMYLCDEADRTCRGHWYDSRGVILPLTVATHADRIVVDWGDATTERGRTVYLVTPDRRLEVTDEVVGTDGRWKVFGRTSSRVSDGAQGVE